MQKRKRNRPKCSFYILSLVCELCFDVIWSDIRVSKTMNRAISSIIKFVSSGNGQLDFKCYEHNTKFQCKKFGFPSYPHTFGASPPLLLYPSYSTVAYLYFTYSNLCVFCIVARTRWRTTATLTMTAYATVVSTPSLLQCSLSFLFWWLSLYSLTSSSLFSWNILRSVTRYVLCIVP